MSFIKKSGLFIQNRNSKLTCCKELLGVAKDDEYKASYEYETWEELLFYLTGIDITECPCCSKGKKKICT